MGVPVKDLELPLVAVYLKPTKRCGAEVDHGHKRDLYK